MPPPDLLPPRGFSASEYQQRCARMQQKMAAAQIDVALFTGAAEFHYFCGFQTPFWHSPTRPWFLLLPASGAPVAVIPAIGAALMQQCQVQEIRTWPSPHPTDDGVSALAGAIRALAGGGCVALGITRGRQSVLRMPLADFDRLCGMLPKAQLRDISGMVQDIRMVKSAAEIEKIAAACAIAGSVFDGWNEWLRRGMAADDIFRQFKMRCLQAGADDVAYLAGGIGRGGYADVISPPDGSRFDAGSVLMLDTGCTYDGYHCDFDRNIACATADDASHRCYEALWQATEAGLQAATAGRECRQVFSAMHEAIAAAGLAASGEAEVGRYGHGLGLELTETPSLAAWDDTPLAAGMVLTLEPSAMVDGSRMLVHEENIVVSSEGAARLLTRRAPPQLPVYVGE